MRSGGEHFEVRDERTLEITGPPTEKAAQVLRSGAIDTLVLNHARGFQAFDLQFVEPWPIQRLDLLDRGIRDLQPLEALGDALESVPIQAAPGATLDLAAFPRLRALAGVWDLFEATIDRAGALHELTVLEFDQTDLWALHELAHLASLVIKNAPRLTSTDGLSPSPLRRCEIVGARRLIDVGDLFSFADSVDTLKLENCPRVESLDGFERLTSAQTVGFSDCTDIDSLRPLQHLAQIQEIYAWGSTRVLDRDLEPLTAPPLLRELRMRDRAEYRPRVKDIHKLLEARAV